MEGHFRRHFRDLIDTQTGPETPAKTGSRDARYLALIASAGLLLLALQWWGSAWSAEFNGYPDEAAQFVSGQLIRHFVSSFPVGNPIDWAGQYYLHYPKVAIGHWPPGYHILEAFWSMLFGPSRISAMWLQWLLGLAAVAGICELAWTRLPRTVTCGIVLLTIASPVFQRGLEQTMAELACLLCGVLFLHTMVQLLEHPGQRSLLVVLVAIAAATLIKGTGVCLVPVPVPALLLSGRRVAFLSGKAVTLVIAAGVVCVVCYSWAGDPLSWGGMRFNRPWPIATIGGLAGWGCLALAVFGVRRQPLPLAAACTLLSAVLFSFFVRAMNEPRHWIIVLPSILLLAGQAVASWPRWMAPLLCLSLLLFPFSLYRQEPAGYRDLFRQLPLPARILVSAGEGTDGEGACVAEVNLLDKLFASFVLRGSKVLSESSWSGDNYRLLVSGVQDVERRLDELAVDEVILDSPASDSPAHHVLLRDTVAQSESWKLCAQTSNLVAYCRTAKPRFLRIPLELTIAGRRFVERLPGGR